MVKKKFESQIRYEEENPAITFRSKKHEKEKIVKMAKKSGKSVSELVKIALLGLEKDFSKAYDKALEVGYNKGYKEGHGQGYNEGHKQGYKDGHRQGHKEGESDGDAKGYNRAKKEFALPITCKICGVMVEIEPNSYFHKKIDEYMDSIGWTHEGCPGRYYKGRY